MECGKNYQVYLPEMTVGLLSFHEGYDMRM